MNALLYMVRPPLAAAILCSMLLVRCAGTDVTTPPPTRELTKSESDIVAADNTFGLNLFREVERDQSDKNVFVSPLSISMALAMTLNGARGATLDSMRATLALQGLTQDDINGSYRTLIDLLRSLDPQVTFEIANSIWHVPTLNVDPAFIGTNRKSFDAEVTSLDFALPDAVTRINSWVSAKTHGKIPTIVDEIPRDMVMYLINALYFKGSWATKFHPDSTKLGGFNALDGTIATVPMMFRSGSFDYYADADLQAVDLPYGFNRYTMTVLLPKADSDVGELVSSLTAQRWNAITSGLHASPGQVWLPKMKLEWEESLNDWLKRMGMSIAYSSMADFSGIDPAGGLAISDVRHKTFVEINEEGTEAAAVTSVGVVRTSLPEMFTMRMDRPFVFAIREKTTGAIVFVGKVVRL